MESLAAIAADAGAKRPCGGPPARRPLYEGRARLLEAASSHRRALQSNPRNARSLAAMCVVALASGQNDAALKMAMAAVDAAPASAASHVALGQALKACGRHQEAERAYEAALRLGAAPALARLGMGELRLATEQTIEARRQFEMALRIQPGMAAAYMGLGHAFAIEGDSAAALERYEQALALRPKMPEAEFAAGFALARLGRAREAEQRYRRALALRPDFAAAWMNLGALLHERGLDIYAEDALRRAIELRPDLIAGWLNLAIVERERGRFAAAAACLDKALMLQPENAETLLALCQLCARQGDQAGAWKHLDQVLAMQPEHSEALNMKGILLHGEGRFSEAVDVFEAAEAQGHLAASSNRGNSLMDLGWMSEALAAHRLAVARDPKHPGARYNLALTDLRLGNWDAGWAGYEARWHFKEVHRRPREFDRARWRGEPLDGQRVLLHAEQGLGDTIQFCRYAALVAARGGFPVLEVQQPVERLMRSLAVVQAGGAETAVLGQSRDRLAFDLECPLMSLPAVFRTTPVTVPWQGAYLAAELELLAQRYAEIEAMAGTRGQPLGRHGNLRAGVAWAGNPRYKADAQRSMKVMTLAPLLRTPGIEWVSLQKGPAAEQIAELDKDIRLLDLSSGDRDLADTAALVGVLDLVITTDTSIAHLAGAMAKPVWILLPHLADWRWGNEGETTPWYPSARLYRQVVAGDWSGLVSRVSRDLTSLVNK